LEKLRPNTSREHYEKRKKTSLFISLCILRDLSQQKIPRELGGVGDPAIFLCSHVPMERFFDGTDQENSKTQGGKGHSSRKIKKTRRKEKEEIFYIHGGSHTHVFSICQEHPCATLYEENPLIWGPPHQPSALPENEANREGGIMKKAMPSWMKKTLLDEKICFYKVTSKYTAKFLAGYILRGGRTLLDHQPWADY
jgi:hypothetical protein